MAHRSSILAFLLLAGCTPHEGSQEPVAECPAGMVPVEGGRLGEHTIQRMCMDVAEVTTAAYATCVAAGACPPAIVGDGAACNITHADRGAHPINCVSLDQARAHCGWLGKRLPEDVEWTWAARGGLRDTPYPWGRRPLDATRACHDRAALGTCEGGTHPAGASPDGLLDLVGNVSEWTRAEPPRLRGGSWQDGKDLDPAGRESTDPATPATGFRCVVLPFTPVQALEVDAWTPVVPTREELPRLVGAPTRVAPTRPLAHLAPLYSGYEQPEPQTGWPLGEGFIALPPADAAALGLQGGLDRATMPKPLAGFTAVRSLGDAVLMLSGSYSDRKFIAVEREGFKVRWQIALAPLGSMYFHLIGPQTLVGAFYGASSEVLVGFALHDGRELWRVRGGPDAPFTHLKHAWTDGERGYAIGDRGLFAFDLVSGATLWSTAPIDPSCGVATGGGVLVVEDTAGHRVLDPTTGAVTGRIDAGVSTCAWGRGVYDDGVAVAAIDQGRLFAYDPPGRRRAAPLRAFDLRSGAELWRRPGLGHGVLVADHDAVYVERDGEVLVALDAGTGATRAEISIGSTFDVSVAPAGGAAGPLLHVTGTTGTFLLGRAVEAPVPESYVVRGRLSPDGVPRSRVANVSVRVGGHKVRTDAGGRFEVRGRALGVVRVTMGDPRPPEDYRDRTVRFDDTWVALDGSGSYRLADIVVYWWDIA